MSISEAAAFLCQTWPCFPCDAQKRPLTTHGYKDATRDPDAARRLFRNAAAIGVPTGAASGLVAIDLDVKDGRPGLEWLAANEHRLPRTRRHKTRSGGLHLIFQAPAGRTIRNSASRIAPGVDVRGDGGYIVVPPSPAYAIADDAMPAPLPGWLLDLLDPPRAALPVAPRVQINGIGTPYGQAALRNEVDAIRVAPYGAQEETLNRAAFAIGTLVAGGELPEADAWHALAAAANNLPSQPGREPWRPGEAESKARRAFDDGRRNPRQAAPRLTRRVIEEYSPPPGYEEPPPIEEPPPHWGAEPDYEPYEEPRPEPGKAPLKVIRFHEAAPALNAEDFVEGLLVKGAMSVVYGESNSGKTFFALDLALHVAAGKEWRGREVEQGFVLYLALEGSHAILNRVAAFKDEHGLRDTQLPFAIVPVSLNLLDPNADAQKVVDTCQAVAAEFGIEPSLIVVDTLARAIAGGNENAPEDMGSLIRTGDALREGAPAHVMWIHHSGKDQAKGARGHSSLRAATDTEIEVVASGSARSATVTKQRDMECSGAFPFTLRVVEIGLNRRGKVVTSCVVEADDAPVSAAAYRPRLQGHARRAFEILNDLMAGSGDTGFPGAPAGVPSIPDKWWREAFYDRAMPGAEPEAKKKAFQRATKELDEGRYIAAAKGRVWIVRAE